jgi:hypothetical protein
MVLEAAKWAVVDDLVYGETDKRVNWSELYVPVLRLNKRLLTQCVIAISFARYHKMWETLQKDKREKPTPRPTHPEAPTRPFKELGRKKFSHETYGEIALCRVPEHLLHSPHATAAPGSTPSPLTYQVDGAQKPLIGPGTTVDNEASDYANPHTNCTQLLSSPSTLHILSSNAYPDSSKPPPTFIASFEHTFSTHVRVDHFSGNTFNVTVTWANDDVRREVGVYDGGSEGTEQDDGAMVVNLDETFTLEWVPGEEEGLAITAGFWGMEGPDATAPVGKGKEGAEVWFGLA